MTLHKILKLDLKSQVMNENAIPLIDHYQRKNKEVIGLRKDELGEKIMKIFLRFTEKLTQSYLIDDSSKDKKSKGTKKCVIKRKPKLENYENCLEQTQIENKISHLEKNKFDINHIKENYKQFIRSNKSITINLYKDLKVKGIMSSLNELIRLL